MLDAVGIAAIPHARCQPISQPQLLLQPPEQKPARTRRQLPAVKANAHLLAGNRWKVKRKYGIFAHDGCGAPHSTNDSARNQNHESNCGFPLHPSLSSLIWVNKNG